MSIFLPTYFSPILQYGEMFSRKQILFEVKDNFQKQTYRNRCYIYGANGKQLLNIPVSHPNKGDRKKTRDTLVEKGSNWQQQHYKSLKTAYNSSPFFEFYEDDLLSIFSKQYTYLLDVNIDTFLFINDALDLDLSYQLTEEYIIDAEHDFRTLANPKLQVNAQFDPYTQMFDDKFGFIKNLSILDLLFMEGPNSISFL